MTEHWLLGTGEVERGGDVEVLHSGHRERSYWTVEHLFGKWLYDVYCHDGGGRLASGEAKTANAAAEALCTAMGWTEPGGEPSPPKTVRVRIAVHRWRTASGEWRALALGSSHEGDLYARRRGAQLARACDPDPADRGHIVWVEADVPIPTEVVVRRETNRG